MKKFALLALALLLVPSIVYGQCGNEGDPAFWPDSRSFPDTMIEVEISQWSPWYLFFPSNVGIGGGECLSADTFCLGITDTKGWILWVDPPYTNNCFELGEDGYTYTWVQMKVPCTASVGEIDTIIFSMHYCDSVWVCDPSCVEDPPCDSPNDLYGMTMYSYDTLIVKAVEFQPPEFLYILQDTIFPVNIGDDAAEVYFDICSAYECDSIWVVNYAIVSKGLIGSPVNKVDTVHVDGGTCEEVYATLDASLADVCDHDTLTITAYYADSNYYDTCVCVVHVVEPIYIVQDSIFEVEQGQSIAYVPFSICNGNPYAPDKDFGYNITSPGSTNIPPIDQSGTASAVPGGECDYVYGIIDAGTALICEQATLTIVAWDPTLGFYDTCVLIVHIVEQSDVPLFTTPVVTILVLAMILAAAVIMKKRATSRA
jgi:hypothetical protein